MEIKSPFFNDPNSSGKLATADKKSPELACKAFSQ